MGALSSDRFYSPNYLEDVFEKPASDFRSYQNFLLLLRLLRTALRLSDLVRSTEDSSSSFPLLTLRVHPEIDNRTWKGYTVDHSEFIEAVQRRANIGSPERAEQVVMDTLKVLAEYLSYSQVQELASQLPPQIAQYLSTEWVGSAQELPLSEFVERVGEQTVARDPEQAAVYTRAVMRTVEEAIAAGEEGGARPPLPQELSPLLEGGPGDVGLPGSGG